MEGTGLVSVIMPVYNVDKYLSQCLDSVCNQTYNKLEIIVIDDESPDDSGKIADEFAARDKRVKVFHIKNSGAAGARNYGLDNCTGEYIMFVDSDDWLELNAVEELVKMCEKKECQMAMCQYYDEFLGKTEIHKFVNKDDKCTSHDFVKEMIKSWEYIINANKIYKKSAINKIRFIEGRCIDDEFFTYKVVLNVEQIAITTKCLYHYRQRKSSAMGNQKLQKQRFIDQVDFITTRYIPLLHAYPDLKASLLAHLAEVLMSVMRNGCKDFDVYRYAKKKLKKYNLQILFCRGIEKSIKKSTIVYMLGSAKKLIPIETTNTANDNIYFD